MFRSLRYLAELVRSTRWLISGVTIPMEYVRLASRKIKALPLSSFGQSPAQANGKAKFFIFCLSNYDLD